MMQKRVIMMRMTRTTIGIDDDLLRRLKRRAASEDRSIQALVNDLLRQAMAPRKSRFTLELKGFRGEARAGVDVTDRAALAAGGEP